MLRKVCVALALSLGAGVSAMAPPAHAVIQGTSSSLGSYTVRLVGNGYCTGVVIARQLVATAAHCAYGMRVLADGGSVRVIGVAHSAVLDDGRRVSVAGDAAILRLSAPLSGVSAVPVGGGDGDSFTIAGYGTTDESAGAAFGALHEARLVAASARALVDPNRTGSIGASACFGDSGGPVMRGGMLVGIITRAAHPNPRLACGHLTRWAAVSVYGESQQTIAVAARDNGVRVAEPRTAPRAVQIKARRAPDNEPNAFSLFASWFAPKAEALKTRGRRQAMR